ncbi:hypothetical protein D3C76_1385440 [compost metagenome]
MQRIIDELSSTPVMIGVLRAILRDLVRRTRKSEKNPEDIAPIKPQAAGIEATRPAWRMSKPRSLTR